MLKRKKHKKSIFYIFCIYFIFYINNHFGLEIISLSLSTLYSSIINLKVRTLLKNSFIKAHSSFAVLSEWKSSVPCWVHKTYHSLRCKVFSGPMKDWRVKRISYKVTQKDLAAAAAITVGITGCAWAPANGPGSRAGKYPLAAAVTEQSSKAEPQQLALEVFVTSAMKGGESKP